MNDNFNDILYNKYKKYKHKYKFFLNAKGGNNYCNLNSSNIGIGTQLFKMMKNDDVYKLMQSALIDNKYCLIDTANLYENKKILSDVFTNLGIKREHIFIIYKNTPKEDLSDFFNDIDETILNFKYIDCFMFHESIDIKLFLNKSEITNFLIKKINDRKIKYVGCSNIILSQNIINLFKEKDLPIEFIENRINTSLLYLQRDIIHNIKLCNENKIKFIGYGSLGGTTKGPCGRASYDTTIPYIQYNEITHPNIMNISNIFNVDKYMLVLAFLSKKYNIIHIPTTTNIKRITDNKKNFDKSYNLLTDEYINKIDGDIQCLKDIDENYGVLDEYLQEDKSNKLKCFSDGFYNIYNVHISRINILNHFWSSYTFLQLFFIHFFNQICFMIEVFLKYDKVKQKLTQLINLLNELNNEINNRHDINKLHTIFYMFPKSIGTHEKPDFETEIINRIEYKKSIIKFINFLTDNSYDFIKLKNNNGVFDKEYFNVFIYNKKVLFHNKNYVGFNWTILLNDLLEFNGSNIDIENLYFIETDSFINTTTPDFKNSEYVLGFGANDDLNFYENLQFHIVIINYDTNDESHLYIKNQYHINHEYLNKIHHDTHDENDIPIQLFDARFNNYILSQFLLH
jgi:diketogulonate reductase-like aldo/keto reductase